jgi:hypothetical protein
VNAIGMITVIDANLGELSRLHEASGFDVHGVAIDAVVLPDEWKRRAITARNVYRKWDRLVRRSARCRREQARGASR